MSEPAQTSEEAVAGDVHRPKWPLTCTCGEEWPRDCWSELPPIGRYNAGRDGWIELRRCVCGATLTATDADLA